MTKQELLKPRYKVIASYPESPFEINQVIDGNILVTAPIGLNEPKYASDFPHLFKKLEWYEERDEKDIPKYVEVLEDIPYYGFRKGQIVLVTEIKKGISSDMNKYSITLRNKPLIDLSAVTPADLIEEELEDRLNLKEIKFLYTKKKSKVCFVHEINEFHRYPSNNDTIENIYSNVELYIVSNEDIKLNDYYFVPGSNTSYYGVHRATTERLVDLTKEYKAQKVIASTQELEGVVQFSDKLIDLAIKQLNVAKIKTIT